MTTPTESSTLTVSRQEDQASVEVAKIFTHLKSGPMHKPSVLPSTPFGGMTTGFVQCKPMLASIKKKLKIKRKVKLSSSGREKVNPSGVGGRFRPEVILPGHPSSREVSSVSVICKELVEEMKIGNLMVIFCRNLPIIKELVDGPQDGHESVFSFLTSGPGEEEEGETGLAPLIKGLVIC